MLSFIRRLLDRNDFFRNVLVLSGGTVIAQSLVLVFSPVLSRIYSASDFGIYQQYQSILSILVVAGSLRFDMAILVPKEKCTSYSLLFIALVINVLIFLLIVFISIFIEVTNVDINIISGLNVFLWFIPFSFLLSSVYLSLTNVVILEKDFRLVSKTKIFQSSGLVSGQIGVGYMSQITSGLFLGDIFGKVFGILSFLGSLRQNLIRYWHSISYSSLKLVIKRYKKYPLVAAPGAILNSAGFAIPTLLIGDLFGLMALGFFALVERVFNAPSLLVGQSVSQVYMASLNELKHSKSDELRQLFLGLIKKLMIISVIPLLIFSIFAPAIFGFVFGEEWYESGLYFRALLPMQIMSFVSWPLIPTLNILELQRTQFTWEATRLVCSVSILLIMAHFDYSSLESVFAYALIMAFFYALHLVLSYRAIASLQKKT